MAPATEGKRAEGGGRGWGREVEEGQEPGGVKGVEEVVQHQPTNQPTLQSLESEEACMTEKEVEKGFGRGGGVVLHVDACLYAFTCVCLSM